jgi:hypothetical protein
VKRPWLAVPVLLVAGLSVVPPSAEAAPGGDASLVVTSGTIDVAGGARVLTSTTMCPEGTRATGGGAFPVSPLGDGHADMYRINYTAPVDESGLASNTHAGDLPRGWQVTLSILGADADGSMRFYAICSTAVDATIAVNQPGVSGVGTVTASCPAGSRALGGGVGKTNDTVIPVGSSGPLIYQSGPVDASGTVAGTQPGDVATGWRTVMAESPYGNRFFAVCSVASDAVVASGSFTLARTDTGPKAGFGSATCPAGTRALSQGLAVDGDDEALQQNRLAFVAPADSLAGSAGAATGQASRSALVQGRASNYGATTYRVFLVCAAESPPDPPDPPDPPGTPAPTDTTAPDTTITKGPDKKTLKTKASFTFTSEAGAAFTCKVDKHKAKACGSPLKLKNLAVGKHKITVTATDPAGNVEKKPATYTWKVLQRCAGACRRPGAQESGA